MRQLPLSIRCLLCLCLLLFPLDARAQPKWEKIIDDGEPGYSETGKAWRDWKIGSAYKGDYRYLSHYDKGLPRVGTASWQTKVPHTGLYEVHAHIRQTVNRTPDADYKFSDGNGKSHHVVLNQKILPTGWHKLGTFYWKAGQISKITLDGTDDNESDEADAMRWRYIGTGGPPPPPEKCQPQQPGTYTLTRYAKTAKGSGDWSGSTNTTGAPDGKLASSPNVDAADTVTGSDFSFCTPPNSFRITAVKIGVMARMQYDSGQFKLVMYLQSEGKTFTFSQSSLKWISGDITAAKANWQIADANALKLKVGLHQHPGGKRDSDAWIDAFRVEITYEVTKAPPQCPTGQLLCGSQCVNTKDNAKHCGACNKACATDEVCNAGTCAFKCPPNAKLCGPKLCADTNNNAQHCGACNKACNAPSVCSQGSCSQSCAPPTTLCGNKCVNTNNDAQHCGSCSKSCKESETCQSGNCTKSCSGAEILCGGQCVVPNTNAQHCGSCGKTCSNGEQCKLGNCTSQVICQDRQLRCGSECVDYQTNPKHCGVCGNACQSWQSCIAGECIGAPGDNEATRQPEPPPIDAGSRVPPIQFRSRGCNCHQQTQRSSGWLLQLLLLGLICAGALRRHP